MGSSTTGTAGIRHTVGVEVRGQGVLLRGARDRRGGVDLIILDRSALVLTIQGEGVANGDFLGVGGLASTGGSKRMRGLEEGGCRTDVVHEFMRC